VLSRKCPFSFITNVLPAILNSGLFSIGGDINVCEKPVGLMYSLNVISILSPLKCSVLLAGSIFLIFGGVVSFFPPSGVFSLAQLARQMEKQTNSSQFMVVIIDCGRLFLFT
jgi:hypothetical protein